MKKALMNALPILGFQLMWAPSAFGSEGEGIQGTTSTEGALILLGLLAVAFVASSGRNSNRSTRSASLDQTFFN